VGRAASPFIVDDAIVGLAQPLTEALNQLASGPRRACDLIEELGWRDEFYLVPEGNLLVFRGRKTTIVQYATVTSSSLNAVWLRSRREFLSWNGGRAPGKQEAQSNSTEKLTPPIHVRFLLSLIDSCRRSSN